MLLIDNMLCICFQTLCTYKCQKPIFNGHFVLKIEKKTKSGYYARRPT